jgi:hypothetical protein
MKKILFLALFSIQLMSAQQVPDSTAMLSRKNEVRTDLLSLVTASRINLSYERFLNNDFSIGVSLGYADSKKLDGDFDAGYRDNLPKYDVTPFVRYNLSKSQTSFYFAEAFVSANGGDFKETVRKIDGNGNGYYANEKSNYSDFGVGGGLGYKLYIHQKFGVELLVAFGTNLFDRDKSPDTLSRVGLSFGYRF